MAELDPVLIFVRPLNRLGVRYMITGSVASMAYGQPRLTHDVDIVIALNRSHAEILETAFPLSEFYCPPPEVIRIESARSLHGHFNLIHHATGFKADMYPVGNDPLHTWALERRREIRIGDEALPLAPPEYVIIRKLEYYREGGSEKHLLDIRSMLEAPAVPIDTAELDRQIAARNLQNAWQRVQA